MVAEPVDLHYMTLVIVQAPCPRCQQQPLTNNSRPTVGKTGQPTYLQLSLVCIMCLHCEPKKEVAVHL